MSIVQDDSDLKRFAKVVPLKWTKTILCARNSPRRTKTEKVFFGFAVTFLAILSTGCSYRVNLLTRKLTLKARGQSILAVAVQDRRLGVLNGSEDPGHIGVYHSFARVPHNLKTMDRQTLTSVMSRSISDGLGQNGYTCITLTAEPDESLDRIEKSLLKSQANKLVFITVKAWQAKDEANACVDFDLDISIFDRDRKMLTQAELSSSDNKVANHAYGGFGHQAGGVANLYKRILEGLLNQASVLRAIDETAP